jgi:SAM-dependent methyltransferase
METIIHQLGLILIIKIKNMENKISEPTYSVDWFSNNIPIWEQAFTYAGIKGKDNLTFLEIGCFEGRATNYMLENLLTENNCVIHVVDTFQGSTNEIGMSADDIDLELDSLYTKFTNNISQHKDKVIIHKGLSGDILKKDFKNEMFDFIYIDGSHTSYDVLQDAILSHPLLKSGGMIIFDDFGWKDPTNMHPTNSPELGVTCFYNNYENFYNVIFTGYQIGLIKK